MQTVQDISAYQRKGHHPLTIDGQNIFDLSQRDPAAAHALVAREVDRRGGHKPLIEFRARQCKIREAMAVPLPGAAGDALLEKELRVSGRKVYKIFPAHILALQAVDSPILKMGREASEKGRSESDLNEQQQWDLCFIITTDPKTIRKMVNEVGGAGISSAAEKAIDGVWDAAEIQATCAVAMSQYAKHVQTFVKLTGEAAKDDHFFRELLEKVSKQAA